MKSYKEFAEEAEYLEENLGRAVKNLFRGKKKVDIPSGAGKKAKKAKNKGNQGGSGGPGILKTAGTAGAAGAVATGVSGALRGAGNLVGNLAKGALSIADKTSGRHDKAPDSSEGKPTKALDKIT